MFVVLEVLRRALYFGGLSHTLESAEPRWRLLSHSLPLVSPFHLNLSSGNRSYHMSLPIHCRWSGYTLGESIVSSLFVCWQSLDLSTRVSEGAWKFFRECTCSIFAGTIILSGAPEAEHWDGPVWPAWIRSFLEVMLPAGSQDLCGTCSMDEGRTWLGKAKRSNKFSSIGNQVPLYMTLGLAVAFALTFSIVDAGTLESIAASYVGSACWLPFNNDLDSGCLLWPFIDMKLQS